MARSALTQWRCRHPAWLLLCVAVAARILPVSVRYVIGTDEGLFLTLGQSLAGGLGYTGDGRVVQVDFPPGFSLYAAAVYALGGGPELPSRLNVLLWGSLIVVPVYWLGRQLAGEPAGFRAGLLTALLPALVLAQANFEAVAEPLYSLLLLAGWALLWWALNSQRRLAFGLAGLALGAAHLVRWEAVVLALIAAALVAVRLRQRALQPLALFLAGVAVLAVPYAGFLYQHTGSFVSPKATITRLHGAALEANTADPFAFEKSWAAYEAYLSNPRQRPEVPKERLPAFAARYVRNTWHEVQLWFTSASVLAVVWLVPALVGLWHLPRWTALYLSVLFLPLAAIPASVVDPRYFLPILPVAMILAGNGWIVLDRRLQLPRGLPCPSGRARPGLTLLAATLVVFVAGDLAGPFLVPRPLEYRAAGEALRDQLPAGARVLARKRQAPFYAGAYWEWLPYADLQGVLDYAAARGADFLVLDERTTPGLRPQLAYLLEPSAAPPALTPIYVSAAGPRVVVYEIRR